MPTLDWLKQEFDYGYSSGELEAGACCERSEEEQAVGGSYDRLIRYGIEPYLKSTSHVLELGPGRGSWTRVLLRRLSEGRLTTADLQDVSPWLAEELESGRLSCVRVSDNQFVELPDDTFDFFWSFGVLCHCNRERIAEILTNSLAKMRPGGLAVHEFGAWEKLDTYGWKRGRVPLEFREQPDDAIWWPRNSVQQMAEMARAAGWKVLVEDLGLLERDGVIVLAAPGGVDDLIDEADRLARQQYYLEAIKLYEQVMAESGPRPGVAYRYGECLTGAGRYEEALEAYRLELRLTPMDQALVAKEAALAENLTVSFVSTAELDAQGPDDRSFGTSIPLPFLQGIQRALHTHSFGGVPMLKNPFDLAIYSRLLGDIQPRTVIEIGSKSGGSGLWFACEAQNLCLDAHVYSIDIVQVVDVAHPRLTFIEADGRRLSEFLDEEWLKALPRPWVVIEDADHAYETSYNVAKFFASHLCPGDYLVVEDGIISDLAPEQFPDYSSGPHRAIKQTLAEHPGKFEIDASYCDMFGQNVTWATNGFLRCVGLSGSSAREQTLVEGLRDARLQVARGQVAEAIDMLNRLKAYCMPTPGIDYCRAVCFEQMGDLPGARLAAREEVRWHPWHEPAKQIATRLAHLNAVGGVGDEFDQLHQAIDSFTMLTELRLRNLYEQVRSVCELDLRGDIVECGVAAGGSLALMAATVDRYSRSNRVLYGFDTFSGMPKPTAKDHASGVPALDSGWGEGTCSAPLDSLSQVCRRLSVQAEVAPVVGDFAETLPRWVAEKQRAIAVLHADGDWFESTRCVFEHLYDLVIPGGIIQIDDYGHWDGCREAVDAFIAERGLSPELLPIDYTGRWFRKP